MKKNDPAVKSNSLFTSLLINLSDRLSILEQHDMTIEGHKKVKELTTQSNSPSPR